MKSVQITSTWEGRPHCSISPSSTHCMHPRKNFERHFQVNFSQLNLSLLLIFPLLRNHDMPSGCELWVFQTQSIFTRSQVSMMPLPVSRFAELSPLSSDQSKWPKNSSKRAAMKSSKWRPWKNLRMKMVMCIIVRHTRT